MSESRRVTQNDIARKAGVHRATVSLVFKNHPGIPPETKERIHKIAQELGYSPDPMLSALAAYRNRHKEASFHGTIAWLVNSSDSSSWIKVPHFKDYYEGARVKAVSHGYHIEIFHLREKGMTPKKMSSIFYARNIRGILMPPQPAPETEINDFPWDKFAAVTFGYSLVKPQLHTVTATQFRSMLQTMRKLRELGFKRIGLVLHNIHDRRTDHNYLAGYLVEQYSSSPNHEIIPPYDHDISAKDNFLRWFHKYQPDAIVSDGGVLPEIRAMGIKVPNDVSVAAPNLYNDKTEVAGVREDCYHIGEVAVNFLVGMILNGERGIPRLPQRIHVEGTWTTGKTIRTA